MALTEKQELFCQRYLIDFNATQSAKDAGYSADTAYSIGWENLKKPEIQERINQLRLEIGDKFNITRERIAQEYAKLAFFDIRRIHSEDGSLKAVNEFDDESAAAVAGIEVYEERVEGIPIGQTKKVKIADKRAALDSLCKLMGYNAPDKTELSGLIKFEQITGMKVE